MQDLKSTMLHAGNVQGVNHINQGKCFANCTLTRFLLLSATVPTTPLILYN